MVEVLRILLQTFAAERLRTFAGSQASEAAGVQAAIEALLDVCACHAAVPATPPWQAAAAAPWLPHSERYRRPTLRCSDVLWRCSHAPSRHPSHTLTLGLVGCRRQADPEEWDGVMRAQLLSDDAACTPDELATMLQDKMGEVVLGMPAGSTVQNVVAEYLNELISRTRAIAAEEA